LLAEYDVQKSFEKYANICFFMRAQMLIWRGFQSIFPSQHIGLSSSQAILMAQSINKTGHTNYFSNQAMVSRVTGQLVLFLIKIKYNLLNSCIFQQIFYGTQDRDLLEQRSLSKPASRVTLSVIQSTNLCHKGAYILIYCDA